MPFSNEVSGSSLVFCGRACAGMTARQAGQASTNGAIPLSGPSPVRT